MYCSAFTRKNKIIIIKTAHGKHVSPGSVNTSEMKIELIRHFAVKKPFLGGLVRQSQVIQWFNEYDVSADLDIVPVEHEKNWEKWGSCAVTHNDKQETNIIKAIFLISSKNFRLLKISFLSLYLEGIG